jgi:hypothetical protein
MDEIINKIISNKTIISKRTKQTKVAHPKSSMKKVALDVE